MDAGKPTVGVVFTMLELYRTAHPDRPKALGDLWRGVVEDLLGGEADLVFTGVSHAPDEVDAAVEECIQADCDLLMVLPLSYAASGSAIDALSRTSLPLLVVSSARDATLPYDMTGDHIMADHAVHGVQDLANVLGREGRRFELVAGHPSQDRFREAVVRTARAATGAEVFRKGVVGQLGEAFEGMLDFDPGPHFADRFGMEVRRIDPQELTVFAGNVDADRIADLTHWASTEFEPDGSVTPDLLATSARVSLALEDLVEAGDLAAVTMNFLQVAAAGVETMPFLGASRLMADGVGYAGESDLMTASLVAAVARACGGATFTEVFCPDYERNEVLLAHMGECNLAFAAPGAPVRLIAKEFAYGDCKPPVVPVFQLRPGPVTLCCLTQWPGEGYRLIACTGEIGDAPVHPNLTMPYSRLSFGGDLAEFLEAYSRVGGIHHLALAYGNQLPALETLARFAGFGFAVV